MTNTPFGAGGTVRCRNGFQVCAHDPLHKGGGFQGTVDEGPKEDFFLPRVEGFGGKHADDGVAPHGGHPHTHTFRGVAHTGIERFRAGAMKKQGLVNLVDGVVGGAQGKAHLHLVAHVDVEHFRFRFKDEGGVVVPVPHKRRPPLVVQGQDVALLHLKPLHARPRGQRAVVQAHHVQVLRLQTGHEGGGTHAALVVVSPALRAVGAVAQRGAAHKGGVNVVFVAVLGTHVRGRPPADTLAGNRHHRGHCRGRCRGRCRGHLLVITISQRATVGVVVLCHTRKGGQGALQCGQHRGNRYRR